MEDGVDSRPTQWEECSKNDTGVKRGDEEKGTHRKGKTTSPTPLYRYTPEQHPAKIKVNQWLVESARRAFTKASKIPASSSSPSTTTSWGLILDTEHLLTLNSLDQIKDFIPRSRIMIPNLDRRVVSSVRKAGARASRCESHKLISSLSGCQLSCRCRVLEHTSKFCLARTAPRVLSHFDDEPAAAEKKNSSSLVNSNLSKTAGAVRRLKDDKYLRSLLEPWQDLAREKEVVVVENGGGVPRQTQQQGSNNPDGGDRQMGVGGNKKKEEGSCLLPCQNSRSLRFIWLDYCGAFGGVKGRRRRQDIKQLFNHHLIGGSPAILAITTAQRGGIMQIYPYEVVDHLVAFVTGVATGAGYEAKTIGCSAYMNVAFAQWKRMKDEHAIGNGQDSISTAFDSVFERMTKGRGMLFTVAFEVTERKGGGASKGEDDSLQSTGSDRDLEKDEDKKIFGGRAERKDSKSEQDIRRNSSKVINENEEEDSDAGKKINEEENCALRHFKGSWKLMQFAHDPGTAYPMWNALKARAHFSSHVHRGWRMEVDGIESIDAIIDDETELAAAQFALGRLGARGNGPRRGYGKCERRGMPKTTEDSVTAAAKPASFLTTPQKQQQQDEENEKDHRAAAAHVSCIHYDKAELPSSTNEILEGYSLPSPYVVNIDVLCCCCCCYLFFQSEYSPDGMDKDQRFIVNHQLTRRTVHFAHYVQSLVRQVGGEDDADDDDDEDNDQNKYARCSSSSHTKGEGADERSSSSSSSATACPNRPLLGKKVSPSTSHMRCKKTLQGVWINVRSFKTFTLKQIETCGQWPEIEQLFKYGILSPPPPSETKAMGNAAPTTTAGRLSSLPPTPLILGLMLSHRTNFECWDGEAVDRVVISLKAMVRSYNYTLLNVQVVRFAIGNPHMYILLKVLHPSQSFRSEGVAPALSPPPVPPSISVGGGGAPHGPSANPVRSESARPAKKLKIMNEQQRQQQLADVSTPPPPPLVSQWRFDSSWNVERMPKIAAPHATKFKLATETVLFFIEHFHWGRQARTTTTTAAAATTTASSRLSSSSTRRLKVAVSEPGFHYCLPALLGLEPGENESIRQCHDTPSQSQKQQQHHHHHQQQQQRQGNCNDEDVRFAKHVCCLTNSRMEYRHLLDERGLRDSPEVDVLWLKERDHALGSNGSRSSSEHVDDRKGQVKAANSDKTEANSNNNNNNNGVLHDAKSINQSTTIIRGTQTGKHCLSSHLSGCDGIVVLTQHGAVSCNNTWMQTIKSWIDTFTLSSSPSTSPSSSSSSLRWLVIMVEDSGETSMLIPIVRKYAQQAGFYTSATCEKMFHRGNRWALICAILESGIIQQDILGQKKQQSQQQQQSHDKRKKARQRCRDPPPPLTERAKAFFESTKSRLWKAKVGRATVARTFI
eukprot:jgi/Bigna1/73017/fgenesh1_pg.22_\